MPYCPTFGSRVRSDFVGAHSGKLCLCFIKGRTLPKLPLGHWGLWWLTQSVPQGYEAYVANHPRRNLFPQRKFILQRLRCLNIREVAPDIHEDSSRYSTMKSLWINPAHSVNILYKHFKVPGACDNFECQGHELSFIVRPLHWCWTLLSQVCKLLWLLLPHTQPELGHCTFVTFTFNLWFS